MLSTLPRPSDVTRKTQWAAVAGGLGYILVLVASTSLLYETGLIDLWTKLLNTQVAPMLLWGFLGGAIIGAVLAVTFVRYRLVSPLMSVGVVYGVAMYQMGQLIRLPHSLPPATSFGLYLGGWPLLLVLAFGSGYLEHRIRATKLPPENAESQ